LYGKFYNKRRVATGLDRFFLRCGPIRTGPKRSGYGPLISGSVYTGCGCQLPRFEVKNRTRLDFKTLSSTDTTTSSSKPPCQPNMWTMTTMDAMWQCHSTSPMDMSTMDGEPPHQPNRRTMRSCKRREHITMTDNGQRSGEQA
jgi:hypothetical protein